MSEDNSTAEIAAPADPLNTPELNRAAYTFYSSVPRIKALATNMGGKALARVFKAVVEFPLAETEPRFRSQTEKELFILVLSAMSAKNTMASAVVQNSKDLEEQITNGVVQELLEQKEEANGE